MSIPSRSHAATRGTPSVSAGAFVRLSGGADKTEPRPLGEVLEVFDDPRAPLAYIRLPDEPPRWVFIRDLEYPPSEARIITDAPA